MKRVICTVVHPEAYFCHWDQKDRSWYDQEYPEILNKLAFFTGAIVAHAHSLVSVRQLFLEEDASFLSMGLFHALTNHNLHASGLSRLVTQDNPYSHFQEYFTLNGGVPLADEARSLEGFAPIVERYPQLIFQSSHREAFIAHSDAVHMVVGGVFSRCVVNWGNVMKKTFPDIDLCYVDELCIDGNAQGKEDALKLVPQTGGRVLLYEEALALL